jgi:ADP-ribose pyrophosphatase YjhB (NUDIX family)
MVNKFNIRVYGIWQKENKILVSRENIDGFEMLKLPGGGLEFGEGPQDCVVREFAEELGVSVVVQDLLHTTENFVQSAFRKTEQVIAIHYRVHCDDEIKSYNTIQTTNVGRQNIHHFEWMELDNELMAQFTFDMDRAALRKLSI